MAKTVEFLRTSSGRALIAAGLVAIISQGWFGLGWPFKGRQQLYCEGLLRSSNGPHLDDCQLRGVDFDAKLAVTSTGYGGHQFANGARTHTTVVFDERNAPPWMFDRSRYRRLDLKEDPRKSYPQYELVDLFWIALRFPFLRTEIERKRGADSLLDIDVTTWALRGTLLRDLLLQSHAACRQTNIEIPLSRPHQDPRFGIFDIATRMRADGRFGLTAPESMNSPEARKRDTDIVCAHIDANIAIFRETWNPDVLYGSTVLREPEDRERLKALLFEWLAGKPVDYDRYWAMRSDVSGDRLQAIKLRIAFLSLYPTPTLQDVRR